MITAVFAIASIDIQEARLFFSTMMMVIQPIFLSTFFLNINLILKINTAVVTGVVPWYNRHLA